MKYASTHDLRRTFAVRSHQSRIPPHLITKLMRHSDYRVTERYYMSETTQQDAGQIREILRIRRTRVRFGLPSVTVLIGLYVFGGSFPMPCSASARRFQDTVSPTVSWRFSHPAVGAGSPPATRCRVSLWA